MYKRQKIISTVCKNVQGVISSSVSVVGVEGKKDIVVLEGVYLFQFFQLDLYFDCILATNQSKIWKVIITTTNGKDNQKLMKQKVSKVTTWEQKYFKVICKNYFKSTEM